MDLNKMPRYQCHKIVRAVKIQEVNGLAIVPAEDPESPIEVSQEYAEKHNPEAGGYYVIYDDGYQSFSPAAAFESGYTRLQENDRPDEVAQRLPSDVLPSEPASTYTPNPSVIAPNPYQDLNQGINP